MGFYEIMSLKQYVQYAEQKKTLAPYGYLIAQNFMSPDICCFLAVRL